MKVLESFHEQCHKVIKAQRESFGPKEFESSECEVCRALALFWLLMYRHINSSNISLRLFIAGSLFCADINLLYHYHTEVRVIANE